MIDGDTDREQEFGFKLEHGNGNFPPFSLVVPVLAALGAGMCDVCGQGLGHAPAGFGPAAHPNHDWVLPARESGAADMAARCGGEAGTVRPSR